MSAKRREHKYLVLMARCCLIWLDGTNRARRASQVVKHVKVARCPFACLTACLTTVPAPPLGLIDRERKHKIRFPPFRVGQQSTFAMQEESLQSFSTQLVGPAQKIAFVFWKCGEADGRIRCALYEGGLSSERASDWVRLCQLGEVVVLVSMGFE